MRETLLDAPPPAIQTSKAVRLNVLCQEWIRLVEERSDGVAIGHLGKVFPTLVDILGDTSSVCRDFAPLLIKSIEQLSNAVLIRIAKPLFQFLLVKIVVETLVFF